MSTLSWIILACVSLIFSALFSGMEIAYVTSDRVLTGLEISKGGLLGKIINRFYRSQEIFISTLLVGNNIMLVIYGMGAAALLEPWLTGLGLNEGLMLLCSTLISTIIILFVGEFLPKSTFRLRPYNSLKIFALPIYLFYIFLYPISRFITWLSHMLMRMFGVESASAPLGLISVGDLNNYLERTIDDVTTEMPQDIENEVKIFHNALDFSSTQLRDCMIPRNEIVAVEKNASRETLSDLFTSTGRSKIIVYEEDVDNVIGYIHVFELFKTDSDWTQSIKPIVYAPESFQAKKMMQRMLAEKRSLAIVVDEFGGTAGIVTLEDLVEEIFGDILDEHDKSGITATLVAPDTYDFSGRIEVRLLRDEYRLDIPEDDDYQTLAGYILSSVGKIPNQGETIAIGDLNFTIRRRTNTRLELIRVSPIEKTT